MDTGGRWMQRLKQTVVGVLGLLAAFAIIIWFSREGSTPPFVDARGIAIKGSVAEMRWLRLGGVEQSVVIRGRSSDAPVLIWLHGGPGFPETGYWRKHNAELENHFMVAYWTQRGAGRSYSPAIPATAMTLERFVADLDELIEYMQGRFGNRPVLIVGHSWGTSIGVAYAQKRPAKVAAYVGIGQVVNTQEGERRSYLYALSEARRRQDEAGIAALTKLGPPPYGQAEINSQRVWLERYDGGVFRKPTPLTTMLWQSLQEPEVTLYDLATLGPGTNFSQHALVNANAKVDWLSQATRFRMPVFIVSGRHDYMTDGRLAHEYFERIEAPQKSFHWFEESAHSPMFEEADAFNRLMVTQVMPVVEAAARKAGN